MKCFNWRERAASPFVCEKTPVRARGGMAVTNHPLASTAAAEMLAAGGNAVDAAIAALFTLTVVEPMMVGVFGAGVAVIRLADGSVTTIDGYSTAPAAAAPTSFTPVSDNWPDYMETEGRRNAVGPSSVATPGSLMAWCEILSRFGRLPLDVVMEPAIRHAANGFCVTPYLATCIAEVEPDLALDPGTAAHFLPGGTPLRAGDRLVQQDYAQTLRHIAKEGPGTFYGGTLGSEVGDWLAKDGSLLTASDLASYRTIERIPVRGMYRGVEIIGHSLPASGATHIIQMLNILEGYDIGRLGFGTPETIHLLLEALKIAAVDRRAVSGDPAFLDAPVERLIAKDYAKQRRSEIADHSVGSFTAGVSATPKVGPGFGSNESANTTHITIADRDGMIVTATQTINSLFGARIMIPSTGIIPNNCMYLYDPHPGNASSLAPGKRFTSSMSPIIGCRDSKPIFALGLPGGYRIPSAALQAILNLLDHGMALQEAVEAPRVFSSGQEAELETGIATSVGERLIGLGHPIVTRDHIAGGMCAIGFADDCEMTGAACWRADGTAIGIGGGLARAGTSFWPDPRKSWRG